MINVGFKLGLQSSVDNIIDAGKGAEEGSFYLTSDTHRLYIGAKNGDDAYASADGTGTNDITLYAYKLIFFHFKLAHNGILAYNINAYRGEFNDF